MFAFVRTYITALLWHTENLQLFTIDTFMLTTALRLKKVLYKGS